MGREVELKQGGEGEMESNSQGQKKQNKTQMWLSATLSDQQNKTDILYNCKIPNVQCIIHRWFNSKEAKTVQLIAISAGNIKGLYLCRELQCGLHRWPIVL